MATTTTSDSTATYGNAELVEAMAVMPLPTRLQNYVEAFVGMLKPDHEYTSDKLLLKALKMVPPDMDVLQALANFPRKCFDIDEIAASFSDYAVSPYCKVGYTRESVGFMLTNQLLRLFRCDGIDPGISMDAHTNVHTDPAYVLQWPLQVHMVRHRRKGSKWFERSMINGRSCAYVRELLTHQPLAQYVDDVIVYAIIDSHVWSVLCQMDTPADHWTKSHERYKPKDKMWYQLVVKDEQLYVQMRLAYQLDATTKRVLASNRSRNFFTGLSRFKDGMFEDDVMLNTDKDPHIMDMFEETINEHDSLFVKLCMDMRPTWQET